MIEVDTINFSKLRRQLPGASPLKWPTHWDVLITFSGGLDTGGEFYLSRCFYGAGGGHQIDTLIAYYKRYFSGHWPINTPNNTPIPIKLNWTALD